MVPVWGRNPTGAGRTETGPVGLIGTDSGMNCTAVLLGPAVVRRMEAVVGLEAI
jgi:hypothetical protein